MQATGTLPIHCPPKTTAANVKQVNKTTSSYWSKSVRLTGWSCWMPLWVMRWKVKKKRFLGGSFSSLALIVDTRGDRHRAAFSEMRKTGIPSQFEFVLSRGAGQHHRFASRCLFFSFFFLHVGALWKSKQKVRRATRLTQQVRYPNRQLGSSKRDRRRRMEEGKKK